MNINLTHAEVVAEENEGAQVNLFMVQHTALEEGFLMETICTPVEGVAPACPAKVTLTTQYLYNQNVFVLTFKKKKLLII